MKKPLKEYAKDIVDHIQYWNGQDSIPFQISRLPLLNAAMQFYADPSKKNFKIVDEIVNLYEHDSDMCRLRELYLDKIKDKFF